MIVHDVVPSDSDDFSKTTRDNNGKWQVTRSSLFLSNQQTKKNNNQQFCV